MVGPFSKQRQLIDDVRQSVHWHLGVLQGFGPHLFGSKNLRRGYCFEEVLGLDRHMTGSDSLSHLHYN